MPKCTDIDVFVLADLFININKKGGKYHFSFIYYPNTDTIQLAFKDM